MAKALGWILGLVGVSAAVAGVAYAASGGGSTKSAPTSASGTLPAGPYMLLADGAALQPGHVYLISRSTAGIPNLQAALSSIQGEIAADGITVLGSWIGLPPVGWPSNDPNAAAGLFVAVRNTTNSVATGTSGLTVFATGGQTA